MRTIKEVIKYTITLATNIKSTQKCEGLDKKIIEYHKASKIPYAGIQTKYQKISENLKTLEKLGYNKEIINEFESYLKSYPSQLGTGLPGSHVDYYDADLSNSVIFMTEQVTTALIGLDADSN